MNQRKRRIIALCSALTVFLSACSHNPSKKEVQPEELTTQLDETFADYITQLENTTYIESYEESVKTEIEEIKHEDIESCIIETTYEPIMEPEIEEVTQSEEVFIEDETNENNDTILTESFVHYDKKTNYIEKVKNSYQNYTGEEDYTILTGSISQVKRLYEEIIYLLEGYENNTLENEQDIYLANMLIQALACTEDVTSLVYNIHNLYVLQFFTVYPDEEAYYELYNELTKTCGNIDMVNSVYEVYNNLACLMHIRTCPLTHTDVSLDTSSGYKFMYECEELPYGPRCTYTTKLILK